jgi:hypothetical protein
MNPRCDLLWKQAMQQAVHGHWHQAQSLMSVTFLFGFFLLSV